MTPENRTFDPAELLGLLDGRYADVREELRTVMSRPEFAPVVALPTPEYRARVNAARAHMATVLLEAFQRAVTDCEDEDLRSVLKLLCDLYALADLESDRAFFLEHGRLSGPRCKAITREVNRLCNEARLCAGALVDAFGIPDEMLAAPIALGDPDRRGTERRCPPRNQCSTSAGSPSCRSCWAPTARQSSGPS